MEDKEKIDCVLELFLTGEISPCSYKTHEGLSACSNTTPVVSSVKNAIQEDSSYLL